VTTNLIVVLKIFTSRSAIPKPAFSFWRPSCQEHPKAVQFMYLSVKLTDMFTKEQKKEGIPGFTRDGQETIIGHTVKVEGDFISEGNVLVLGVVSGSLKTRGNLRVEKGAKIKADVEAANAAVFGDIKGNVTIQERLELGASAVVEGDIVTKVLSIEPGAIVNGHCAVAAGEKLTTKEAIPATIQKTAVKES
jgi:cytoskeletal protein CcmA (bactofilin family)